MVAGGFAALNACGPALCRDGAVVADAVEVTRPRAAQATPSTQGRVAVKMHELRLPRRGRDHKTSSAHEKTQRRSRTEPSWATEATSVPSGLKISPRVRPRPFCALGDSMA